MKLTMEKINPIIVKMLRKLVVTTTLLVLSFGLPKTVLAQQYGQGSVLGKRDEIVHEPVEAGLGENLMVLGTGLILASGALLVTGKKLKFL